MLLDVDPVSSIAIVSGVVCVSWGEVMSESLKWAESLKWKIKNVLPKHQLTYMRGHLLAERMAMELIAYGVTFRPCPAGSALVAHRHCHPLAARLFTGGHFTIKRFCGNNNLCLPTPWSLPGVQSTAASIQESRSARQTQPLPSLRHQTAVE